MDHLYNKKAISSIDKCKFYTSHSKKHNNLDPFCPIPNNDVIYIDWLLTTSADIILLQNGRKNANEK